MQRANQERGRPARAAPSVTICGVVEASGCVSHDLCRIRDEICRLAGEGGTDSNGRRLFPNVGQTVPVSWVRVWAMTEALLLGGEPLTAARSIGQPVVPIASREKHNFIASEVMLKEWLKIVSALNLTAEVGRTPLDEEQVLKDALKMRQTGGTLLVVCDLVHLDPSWINVPLQALLDHRLADKRQESEWIEQLEGYSASCGILPSELMRLHRNFIRTGRLTETYLHFIWREILELDCPRVFSRMIETMSTFGAMFTCDPSRGVERELDYPRVVGWMIEKMPIFGARFTSDPRRGVERELLVPARLPSAVDGDTLAKLESAISRGVRMRFVIKIFAKYIPAGVIAQFLGSFRRSNHIVFRACWRRGAAFMMNGREHLVCLHEPVAGTVARIEISIAGSTRETVSDHGLATMEALSKLLSDRYPGLSFDASGDPQFMEGTEAWKDSFDSLQAHLERRADQLQQGLEVALENILDACRAREQEQMSKKIDTLVQNLHNVRLRLDRNDPQPLGDIVDTLVRELGAKIDGGGLRDTERQILRRVSLDMACLRWPVPRLACLLPKHEGTLSDDDRSLSRWSDRLRAWCGDGNRAGRGMVRRKLRLFFICAHDYSLAECGPNGQGYKVKQLREWAAKAMPLAKVTLALASITLKVCTGLSIPTDDVDAAFGDSLGGVISDIVKESGTAAVDEMTTVARDGLESGADGQQLEHLSEDPKPRPAPLDGLQYDRLKDVIKRFEVDGVKTRKRDTPFISFEKSMKFVDEHCKGVQWAWVRGKNVALFRS
ncbi:unnamed protein product [Sphacelaria rigidula]